MIRRHYFTAEIFVPSTQQPEKCEVEYAIEDYGIGASAVIRKVTRDNHEDILSDLDADAMMAIESEAMCYLKDEFND